MEKRICPENSEMIYFDDFNYRIETDNSISKPIFDIRDYVSIDNISKVCRMVLTQFSGYSDKQISYYLYWFKQTDLDDIDEKVRSNTYEDIDFKYSIKTEFKPKIICFHCNETLRNALTVSAVQIYPNNFKIGEEKLAMIQDQGLFLKCPKCGKPLTIRDVHFFGLCFRCVVKREQLRTADRLGALYETKELYENKRIVDRLLSRAKR